MKQLAKLSRFFEDLYPLYKAELEDLRTDSEGKDIMRARLKEKREMLPHLLPMMASNPEMLVVAFHDGFQFLNPLTLESLLSKELENLPQWSTLTTSVRLEPWAEKLAQVVLKDAGGSTFLVTAACLEYLQRGAHTRAAVAETSVEEEQEENEEDRDLKENGDLDGQYGRHGRDDGDDGDDYDLEEAGADWLAEQGFDRKD